MLVIAQRLSSKICCREPLSKKDFLRWGEAPRNRGCGPWLASPWSCPPGNDRQIHQAVKAYVRRAPPVRKNSPAMLGCVIKLRFRKRLTSESRLRAMACNTLVVSPGTGASRPCDTHFFFTLVTGPRRSLSLKLSDTRVYEPQIRARLGTTAHLCKVVATHTCLR